VRGGIDLGSIAGHHLRGAAADGNHEHPVALVGDENVSLAVDGYIPWSFQVARA